MIKQDKLQKAALKAEAAELKKVEKEKKKWENGKFALKSIVAEIDAKVIEMGSVGGRVFFNFSFILQLSIMHVSITNDIILRIPSF